MPPRLTPRAMIKKAILVEKKEIIKMVREVLETKLMNIIAFWFFFQVRTNFDSLKRNLAPT